MEDGLANLIAHPLRTIFRPGFWLHGGLFGAALGAMIAQQLGYVPHLSLFAASLAVGLPLYEMFSRIGCHTYGCCYGAPATVPSCHLLWRLFPFAPVTYDHPTDYAVTRVEPSLLGRPLIPIQLISAALFFLLFACVSLPLTVYTTPQLSGAATLAFHAAVRLATETCRADYRGARGAVSSTGQMALVQAAGAGAWLAYVLYVGAATPGELNFRNLWEQERLETCASVALVGIVVYGIHIGEIGTWVPNSNTEKSTS
ncbi:hypothetical protein C8R43DRAFT_987307 [Mycena crocata]|nr:hypothetical protein C8R43DRAFT_987307 [Mycena crocata]